MDVAICPICGKQGHYLSECPCNDMKDYAQPRYLEQLIPPTILRMYNISTLTPIETNHTLEEPLPSQRWYPLKKEPYIILPRRADDIKKELKRHRVAFNESAGMENHLLLLENFARKHQRKIIWIQNNKSSESVDEKSQKSQEQPPQPPQSKPKPPRKVSKTKATDEVLA